MAPAHTPLNPTLNLKFEIKNIKYYKAPPITKTISPFTALTRK